jgi:hypothetical protein
MDFSWIRGDWVYYFYHLKVVSIIIKFIMNFIDFKDLTNFNNIFNLLDFILIFVL